jgi:hypothetical protein
MSILYLHCINSHQDPSTLNSSDLRSGTDLGANMTSLLSKQCVMFRAQTLQPLWGRNEPSSPDMLKTLSSGILFVTYRSDVIRTR